MYIYILYFMYTYIYNILIHIQATTEINECAQLMVANISKAIETSSTIDMKGLAL